MSGWAVPASFNEVSKPMSTETGDRPSANAGTNDEKGTDNRSQQPANLGIILLLADKDTDIRRVARWAVRAREEEVI